MKCSNCGSEAKIIYINSVVCDECDRQIKGEIEMRMEELYKEVARTFDISQNDIKLLVRKMI